MSSSSPPAASRVGPPCGERSLALLAGPSVGYLLCRIFSRKKATWRRGISFYGVLKATKSRARISTLEAPDSADRCGEGCRARHADQDKGTRCRFSLDARPRASRSTSGHCETNRKRHQEQIIRVIITVSALLPPVSKNALGDIYQVSRL